MSGAANDNKQRWWVDFVAGWVSGAISVVACQPLDTVLTRFQATTIKPNRAFVADGLASTTTTTTSLGSSVRGLAKEFGVASLWRGSSPMIGAVPIQNALLMGGYGFGKRYSQTTTEQRNLLPVFVGGCVGGVLQSFLMSPVEWIKIHQQTTLLERKVPIATTGTTSSTRSLVKALLRPNNGLWNRGLTATLLRDGIPHGVWFASYEWCKTELLLLNSNSSNADRVETNTTTDNYESSFYSGCYYENIAVPMIAGAFAATTAWVVGYPFDIIKTRIQASTTTTTTTTVPGSSTIGGNTTSVPGVWATARQLVTEADGHIVKGLYRGFGWKILRSIPASMIGFLSYEVVSKELNN